MVTVVAVSLISGAWLVGAQDEPAGFVVVSVGLVMALFFALVLLGSPPAKGLRINYFQSCQRYGAIVGEFEVTNNKAHT